MSVEKVLDSLIEAGLDSLPGGGAEILVEPTRTKIAPGKCSGQEWLDVMRTCHKMGLKTTATMVIGFGESIDERLDHLRVDVVESDVPGEVQRDPGGDLDGLAAVDRVLLLSEQRHPCPGPQLQVQVVHRLWRRRPVERQPEDDRDPQHGCGREDDSC